MADTGRPPVFDSPEEMQAKINAFFDSLEIEIGGEESFLIKTPTTITGLALYLGFESRQSFYDYEKKPEFSYIIKRARLKVEYGYELALSTAKNPTGSIFALKNMGWSDKQEIDQKTEHSGGITIKFEEPDVQHPEDKSGNGELPGLQSGLPDNR